MSKIKLDSYANHCESELSVFTDYLNVRLQPGDLIAQIDRLEEVYESFNPNKPFEFVFVDEELDRQYENEIRQGRVMTLFSIIAIVLSCLGILGLITTFL